MLMYILAQSLFGRKIRKKNTGISKFELVDEILNFRISSLNDMDSITHLYFTLR